MPLASVDFLLNMTFWVLFQGMYANLHYWGNHHNREMLHAGITALEAFFKQVQGLEYTVEPLFETTPGNKTNSLDN